MLRHPRRALRDAGLPLGPASVATPVSDIHAARIAYPGGADRVTRSGAPRRRRGSCLPLLVEWLSAEDPTWLSRPLIPSCGLNRPDAAQLVLDAFLRAQGGRLEGLRQALCHGPVSSILQPLRDAAKSAEPLLASAALEVLAFQSPSDCEADLLVQFLLHETPEMRRGGWRVAELLKNPLVPHLYKKALEDDDPRVRSEACWAAAWARQTWLLGHCRTLAKSPNPENLDVLQLLAILGGPETSARSEIPAGPNRSAHSWFKILGSFGYPEVIADLIQGMENPNPRLAVAAGGLLPRSPVATWCRRPGYNCRPKTATSPMSSRGSSSTRRSSLIPTKARDLWNKVKGMYRRGPPLLPRQGTES